MNSRPVEFVRTIVPLPAEEEEKFLRAGRWATIKQGEAFIKEGAVPQKLAFVAKGLFRYFYQTSAGKEFTKGFFMANSFITAYSALAQQVPSTYTVEALEDSEVFVIDYHDWRKLFEGHECWKLLLIAYLQKGYFKKEKREREFLLLDARARYQSFLDDYPELEGRLTQSMIASYLGITPVALSRIRSQRAH